MTHWFVIPFLCFDNLTGDPFLPFQSRKQNSSFFCCFKGGFIENILILWFDNLIDPFILFPRIQSRKDRTHFLLLKKEDFAGNILTTQFLFPLFLDSIMKYFHFGFDMWLANLFPIHGWPSGHKWPEPECGMMEEFRFGLPQGWTSKITSLGLWNIKIRYWKWSNTKQKFLSEWSCTLGCFASLWLDLIGARNILLRLYWAVRLNCFYTAVQR